MSEQMTDEEFEIYKPYLEGTVRAMVKTFNEHLGTYPKSGEVFGQIICLVLANLTSAIFCAVAENPQQLCEEYSCGLKNTIAYQLKKNRETQCH